jgi:ADP-L-glycero-D-manno-heptose 6-epimerase
MSNTFVVTGANGFIGTNIVERILSRSPEELGLPTGKIPHFSDFEENSTARSCSVIASDLSSSLVLPNARRFSGSVRYHYADYKDLISYLETLKTPPVAVIHNGACSSTTEQDPAVFEELNWGYTQKLWNYCVRFDVPLIYASSAATYGDGTKGFSDKKEDCHKYTSLNLYGKSKLDFDLWALEQPSTPPSWFGLRYFNVYGQYESHKKGQASMVFHGYHQALQTGKIRLFKSNTPEYTDGGQERDFVYVDDIVDVTEELIRLCIKRKQNPTALQIDGNGLFVNIGTGVAETWNHLAQEVFESLGLKTNIEYIPIPPNIANQYQNYTCADLSTLRSLGIHHSFKSLQDGVRKYVLKHLTRGQ